MTLILFDFDGVLADTLGDLLQFGQEVCDELNVKHVATPKDLDSLEIMSFATFGRQLEVPEDLLDEFVSRCLKRFVEKPHPPRMFDGMAQVIEQLSSRHTIGIVSGNTTLAVDKFLLTNNIHKCVSVIYTLDQPGTKVEKLLRAKNQLADPDEEVYYFGDSASDIHAARNASIKSVAVSWGHQSLSKLADAKPFKIVHTPQEIIEFIENIR